MNTVKVRFLPRSSRWGFEREREVLGEADFYQGSYIEVGYFPHRVVRQPALNIYNNMYSSHSNGSGQNTFAQGRPREREREREKDKL